MYPLAHTRSTLPHPVAIATLYEMLVSVAKKPLAGAARLVVRIGVVGGSMCHVTGADVATVSAAAVRAVPRTVAVIGNPSGKFCVEELTRPPTETPAAAGQPYSTVNCPLTPAFRSPRAIVYPAAAEPEIDPPVGGGMNPVCCSSSRYAP
ncbi:hypothetical protein G5T42_05125 [Microbacterium sp. 4R-513]|uniref:hypothetical protein n=1 Tax=Microbacterium sp. 4R-513 TaxID=2567934 RepID=UPI0013E1979A|nr:hypothetical protein [Microbacterium sp. 4R-513]QIG38946.1 hypothetical protein G5T42_05125 [Microbacterium sp. 4R-513]